MGYPIRTNKIKLDVDYSALASMYDFFCVSTSEKYFSHSATILDAGNEEKNICAIKYEKGNTFYVMMTKSPDNTYKLKSALHKFDGAEKISFVAVSAQDIEPYILLQLLLNSLSWVDNPLLSFNNLTGSLYCFNTNNMRYSHNGDQQFIKQIICLEISVDGNLCLHLNVRTFTNVKYKNKITFDKRKFEEYPQYIISNKNTLKRKTNTDEKADAFIMRQFDGKKTEIPFMSINNLKDFNSSKMGTLTVILELFKKKYKGIVTIDFDTIDNYIGLDYKKNESKSYKKRAAEIINKANLRIIDKVNNEESSLLIADLRECFFDKYGVLVPVKKGFSKNGMNICIIHNKGWYEGQNDQYAVTDKYALQHVTIEDFLGKGGFTVDTVANELIIKHDLQNKQLRIFDWKGLHYSGDWVFGIKEDINDIPRYFFMTIHNDGTFEFSEIESDLFSTNEYCKYANILDDKTARGVIVNNNGDINIIKDTDLFTLPRIEEIQEHLKNGDNHLRSKDKKEELLYSCLDIKYSKKNDQEAYYFAGTIGEGMRQKISDACLIRGVEAYEESTLFFNEFLPLIDITFVRNGQLTVIPFPFKYLREWIKTHI